MERMFMPESVFFTVKDRHGFPQGREITPTLAGFEEWLTHRNFKRPEDAYSEAEVVGGDCPRIVPAADLVHSYLQEHPGLVWHEQVLMDYAKTIGEVTNQW
jgi:hypothetical protein